MPWRMTWAGPTNDAKHSHNRIMGRETTHPRLKAEGGWIRSVDPWRRNITNGKAAWRMPHGDVPDQSPFINPISVHSVNNKVNEHNNIQNDMPAITNVYNQSIWALCQSCKLKNCWGIYNVSIYKSENQYTSLAHPNRTSKTPRGVRADVKWGLSPQTQLQDRKGEGGREKTS